MIEEDVKTVVQLLENKRKVCALLAPTVEKTLGDPVQKEMFYKKVCALLAPTVEKTLGDPVQKEMFYKALSDAGFFTWRQIAEEANQLALREVEEWESRTEDKKIIISSSCPAIVRLVEKEYPELSAYLSSTKSPMHLDKKIIISSSCPAIVRLVEKEYPELSVYLSSTKSPMHLASFKVKEENANVKTVFIGPCYWKKEEQKRQLNEKGQYLSSTKSPMHLASFKVKEENANVKTVFIGPCYWKKEEQKRQLNEKGHVDVVLTFEEFIEVLKNLKMDFEWEYTTVDKEIIHGENIDMPGQMAFCVQERMKRLKVKAMPQFLTGAGIDECKKILNDIRQDEYRKCYIELLACKDGCGVKEYSKAMPQFLTGAGIDECKKILNDIRQDEYRKCYIELLACKDGCGVKEYSHI